MGMGTTGIPREPWDSHGYGNDGKCTMGIGMGIKAWNVNKTVEIRMIFHYSGSPQNAHHVIMSAAK